MGGTRRPTRSLGRAAATTTTSAARGLPSRPPRPRLRRLWPIRGRSPRRCPPLPLAASNQRPPAKEAAPPPAPAPLSSPPAGAAQPALGFRSGSAAWCPPRTHARWQPRAPRDWKAPPPRARARASTPIRQVASGQLLLVLGAWRVEVTRCYLGGRITQSPSFSPLFPYQPLSPRGLRPPFSRWAPGARRWESVVPGRR